MIILYKLLILLITFVNYSYANNIDIQKQLDIQNEIIDIQSKRIDQLEIIIKELKNNIPSTEHSNNSQTSQVEEKQ